MMINVVAASADDVILTVLQPTPNVAIVVAAAIIGYTTGVDVNDDKYGNVKTASTETRSVTIICLLVCLFVCLIKHHF